MVPELAPTLSAMTGKHYARGSIVVITLIDTEPAMAVAVGGLREQGAGAAGRRREEMHEP
jgi:hypothetical protein